jgi:hypothetical protein
MAPVLVKAEPRKCRTRDELILAFLLAINRMNEDNSLVESARSEEFREEARVVLEQSRTKCQRLQALIATHCLNHRC